MAQSALQIPEPLSEDPEAVATALETAAIFGAQGDAREALRWLRRAAELASDDGQDMRALNLARMAADLSSRLQTSSAPPMPAMPSRPPAPSQREAPTSSRNLRQLPPLERTDPRMAAVADAPPPPPPPPLPPPHQAFSRPARETYAEASRRVDADAEALTTPRRRMTDPGPGPMLDVRGGLPPFTAALQAVPEPEPEPELTLPRVEMAALAVAPPPAPPPPREEMISATDESRPTPIPDASPGALFRQTVRVSVSPNPGKPGSFVVELLEEDESAGEGSDEAFLVLLDPHSQILQG